MRFSALQRAEIAEMHGNGQITHGDGEVSVLFNEPKLLKYVYPGAPAALERRFSALQRAEIAEIFSPLSQFERILQVSVLFNEPKLLKLSARTKECLRLCNVSVLFNEPKLLKC